MKAGGDSRFDEVKHKPAVFAGFWMAQATWVMLVGLPVYMVGVLLRSNSYQIIRQPCLSIRDATVIRIPIVPRRHASRGLAVLEFNFQRPTHGVLLPR